MRTHLKPLEGKWLRWYATLALRSKKIPSSRSKNPGKTVLLSDLRSTNYGGVEIEHVWLDAGDWSKNIPDGSRIRLDAIVIGYRHGDGESRYTDPEGKTIDYKIASPRKVRVLQ